MDLFICPAHSSLEGLSNGLGEKENMRWGYGLAHGWSCSYMALLEARKASPPLPPPPTCQARNEALEM